MSLLRLLLACCCAAVAAGCATPEPGIGKPVDWSELTGWDRDHHAESWPALTASCTKLKDRADWMPLCLAAASVANPSDRQAREFYQRWFTVHPLHAEGGNRDGLITGYYEPLLRGSLQRTERYRYPVYGRPNDLLTVELSELFPELEGKRVRGRLEGNTVVPYPTRAELDANPELLAGHEVAWVEDPIDLFFLHVQGSGRIELPDGSRLAVGYADQNGHAYRSIGRELADMGEIELDEVTLFSIRDWLRRHPERARAVLERNPSFVFFSLRNAEVDGPRGSLNVPLVPERSIAVDPSIVPLGVPVWLDTTLPDSGEPYRRLVLAQDTGGAIKGHVRADLFWGRGERAERMAGRMKQPGRLYVLMPNSAPTDQ